MSVMCVKLRFGFHLFVLYCLTIESLSQVGIDKNDLGELYRAFVDGLSYFNRQYHSLDSDALLGLRVAEGYIHKLLEDTENGRIKLNRNVYNNVTDLLNRITEDIKKIIPLVQKTDPLFYQALNSPWTYYKPYKVLELQDVSERQESKPGDVERYSHCVREIVGSQSEPCTISDECWKTMMTKGAPNSMLYYQALFFILGEASGCRDKLVSRIGSSNENLDTHLQHICTIAYFSNAWTQFREEGKPVDLMLTLKLSFSCGLLGYHELLTGVGLENVIGWQLNSGCYGDYTRVKEKKIRVTETGKRKKNELKSTYLGNGCFSDVTGAGLGLLALYLRWILDPPLQVQPVGLKKSAHEDAQTVSVYMYILLLVAAAFLFTARRAVLQMATTCHAILFGQGSRWTGRLLTATNDRRPHENGLTTKTDLPS